MAYPTIPLPQIVELSISYTPTNIVSDSPEGQIKTYASKYFRNIPDQNISFSMYVSDIATIDNFLMNQKGYIPFVWSYTGLIYVCTEYSITYTNANQGTMNFTFTKVSN
jgi:hypothetical protein